MEHKILAFDVDGTICTTNKNDYKNAVPRFDVIKKLNQKFEQGFYIKIYTARGVLSKIDHTELTKFQLEDWGVKYHELVMNQKIHFDSLIDDKVIQVEDFLKKQTISVVAGCFDIIHPGYIKMLKECMNISDYIIVFLHEDPNLETKRKPSVVLSVEERKEILLSLNGVNSVVVYKTEKDLEEKLSTLKEISFDKDLVRVLGEEYQNCNYTGKSLKFNEYFIKRQHGWSSTLLKEKIAESIREYYEQ